MSLTPNFRFVYIDETTNKYVSATAESRNWNFVDWQFKGITDIIGEGTDSGWDVTEATGLNVDISAGTGLVNGYYCFTSDPYENLEVAASTTNYIYAQSTIDSPLTGEVLFVADDVEGATPNAILLAEVVTDEDSIVSISVVNRSTIGFTNSLQDYLTAHHHDGNPVDFINLGTDVTGILDADNIGDIPASKVTGILSLSQMPQQSHTELSDIGVLTHDELDTYIDALDLITHIKFGSILSTQVAQMLLALAHIYYEPEDPGGFFRFIPNLVLLIPGVTTFAASVDTPNYTDLLDTVNTTAEIDEVNHVYLSALGTALGTPESYSKQFTTDADWNGAVSLTNITVEDGSISLSVLSSTTTYAASGTIVYHYDSGRVSEFTTIEWDATPNGITTPISVRTRTAATELGLDSAPWSAALTATGSAITSQDNRWIEIEVTISTTDTSKTPTLNSLTLNYESVGSGCGRVLWPVFNLFSLETLDGVEVNGTGVSEYVELEDGGTGSYPSSGIVTSLVIDAGANWVEWLSFSWNQTLLTGTTLSLYVKSDDSSVDIISKEWDGPYTANSGVDLSILTTPGQYIQFKALFATTDTSKSPTFKDITLNWKEND